jgi:transcriptional regulator NrdR family protein
MDATRNCPNCKSPETSRSHRRGAIERYLLKTIGVRPFRCLNCDARFYAFSRFEAQPARNDKAA